jgi:hypothetical protein
MMKKQSGNKKDRNANHQKKDPQSFEGYAKLQNPQHKQQGE